MLSLEEALERILVQTAPVRAEVSVLPFAAGRFLAEDAAALSDLPRADNSAMDGYAVRSADVNGAGPATAVGLQCIETVPAGQRPSKKVEAGRCIRLFTGSPMPEGADAVVMQEDCNTTSEDPSRVQVLDPVKPWENVRFRGEDIRQGMVIAKKGERLTAARIGMLAAAGLGSVIVAASPKVAIIPTGSELIVQGQEDNPASVYESNQPMLSALCRTIGVEPLAFPIARDNLEQTCDLLGTGFQAADAVITCGGASVGDYDFVKQAFERLGGKLEFWKVAIRPGKPFIFGQLGSKLLFGLPGNPVSAFVTFFLLARPALLRMQGASKLVPAAMPGILGETIANRGDRRHFMRVSEGEDGRFRLAGGQGSHHLSALAQADGLLDMPPTSVWEENRPVKVIRITE